MRILVTGSKGFIGKNVVEDLRQHHVILEYDIDKSEIDLKKMVDNAEFIIHLAGVNRPTDNKDFYTGNTNFTSTLVNLVEATGRKIPIIMSSTIHAINNSDYGKSKRQSEEIIIDFANRTSNPIYIYRLTNVFGKWCKPNYNSVVATFCHNIANNIDITINNPKHLLRLIHIDDIVSEFKRAVRGNPNFVQPHFYSVEPVYEVTLQDLADNIRGFKEDRSNLSLPNLKDDFVKKLYSTYLSYLSTNDFSYDLKMNCDNRGSFTEVFRTMEHGQFSINVAKPGITKGNHWHHTKHEKFLVVAGKASIQFRKIGTDEIIEYLVSEEKFEVVDIPPGYTHNITNIGSDNLVTFMWANESFDPEKPDTFFLEV